LFQALQQLSCSRSQRVPSGSPRSLFSYIFTFPTKVSLIVCTFFLPVAHTQTETMSSSCPLFCLKSSAFPLKAKRQLSSPPLHSSLLKERNIQCTMGCEQMYNPDTIHHAQTQSDSLNSASPVHLGRQRSGRLFLKNPGSFSLV